MTRRTIGAEERRARLAVRHYLGAGSQRADPVDVAQGIVAYHATDPAAVYLSAAARTGPADPATLDSALYDDRTLVRMLGMRRTMFVVPTALLPIVQAACTDAIAVRERKQTLKMISEGGFTSVPEAWLATAEEATVRALAACGEATTRELGDDIPQLREQVVLARGKPYESTATMGPRVLYQLSAEGKVVRGRPVGSWTGNYRWALTETWLPDGVRPAAAEEADDELAGRWLAAFGPGTVDDLKWWTGWPVTRVRKALARLDAVGVDLDDGQTGYVLPDDVEPVTPPDAWPALLPGLDPAVMGWAMPGRDWFLGERCRDALYDRSGNVGPTVWWDGRVVGAWAQRADGEVVYRLLEDVGSAGREAVEAAASKLRDWLGDVRVTPKFRTPLEKELATL